MSQSTSRASPILKREIYDIHWMKDKRLVRTEPKPLQKIFDKAVKEPTLTLKVHSSLSSLERDFKRIEREKNVSSKKPPWRV